MKKLLTLFFAFLVSISLITGCSNKEPAGYLEQSGSSYQTAFQETITFAHVDTVNTLDPRVVSDMTHNNLFMLLHETLFKYNPKTQEIAPNLATDWSWKDDKTIEIELRDDVYFHNGEKFTADDVVYTLESGKTATGNVSIFANTIASCSAIDDNTVRIELEDPNVDFLIRCGNPMLSILNRKACENDSLKGAFIGCGPWICEELVESDYVKFAHNENYWGDVPVTKYLIYKTIPEDASRAIALQNGEIDFQLEVGYSQINYLKEDPNIIVNSIPVSSTEYFAFGTQNDPGKDLNFRLAIAHAINIDDIIEVAVGDEGTRVNSNWGRSTYGFNESIKPYEYNLELAKEYLEKSSGRELDIIVNSSKRVMEAELIQSQLKEIGVIVTISEVEKATLNSITSAGKHEAVIYSLGWGTFGDDCRRPYYSTSSSNRANIKNNRIDELIDNALVEFDDGNRKKMYDEIQIINHDNAYYIPLYSQNEVLAFHKDVKGYILNSDKVHDFSQVYKKIN